MRKLQWKSTKENDTAPVLETLIALVAFFVIVLIIYAVWHYLKN